MGVRWHAIGRLVLALSLVGLVACGDDEPVEPMPKGGGDVPVVQIEAYPARGPAPLSVAFSAAVTGGNGDKSVAWDFADTATGEGLTATHEFAEPGTYQVRATATDADGDLGSDVVTVVVTSNEAPEVWAHADVTTGLAPLRVAFQAISGGGDGALRFAWEFGDGGESNVANPIHIFEAAGEFTATVKITDQNGDEATADVQIVVLPAGSTGAPRVVAQILSGACGLPDETVVSLDGSATVDPDGDPLMFHWMVTRSPAQSDGGYFSNREGPETFFYPDAAGDFEIRLFVQDFEGTYASAPLLVVADDQPATLTILGGNGQTARVGEVFEKPLLVNVSNKCGLALDDVRVYWYGDNAASESSYTYSDEVGGAWAHVYAGGKIGTAQVRAVAGRANGPRAPLPNYGERISVDFTLDVVAGTPELVLMDAVADAEASDTQGVTLTFRVTDEAGNPLTDHEAEIGLSTVSSPVTAYFDSFSSAMQTTIVTTSGGVATVQLFSSGGAGMARVRIESATLLSTGRSLRGGGWRDVAHLDMEGDDLDWRRIGDWELGAPTSGPGAAIGGTGVLATNLAGNFEHLPVPEISHVAMTLLPSNSGGNRQYYRVRFQHWIDLGPLQPWEPTDQDFRRIDTDEIPTECSAAIARVNFNNTYLTGGSPFGLPYSENPKVGPCWDPWDRWNANQFAGANGGWEEVELWSSSSSTVSSAQLAFELYSNASHGLPNGAGWYVDDVTVDAFYWDYGLVNFLPSASPRFAWVTLREAGSADPACGTPSVVEIGLADAFGNVLRKAGVRVELTINDPGPGATAEIVGFVAGGSPTGTGTTTASATTDESGQVQALVTIDGGEFYLPAQVTASVQGVAGSEGGTSVFRTPTALQSENGSALGCFDGLDNDCDGFGDCADPDCDSVGPCAGLSCASPLYDYTIPEGTPGFAGSLCEWGEDGLGAAAPAGYNDTIVSSTGCGTYVLCLTGPAGVEVEVGDTSGDESCGYLELFEFGEGCHLFTLTDCEAEHYFVTRAPTGECGGVTLVYGPYYGYND